MSNDEFRRLGEELKADFKFLEVMLRQHIIDTDRRLGGVGQQMQAFGAELQRYAAELQSYAANSEERWNQLAGRARLMEGRFTSILAAADRDDVRQYCEKLDERLKAVEERLKLDPPAA